MAVSTKMLSFVRDLIEWKENMMQSLEPQSEGAMSVSRMTYDTFRMRVKENGGTIVLESVDWGHDRVFLFDMGEWTGPEESQNHAYCVAFLLMDGYLADFSGPLTLSKAHDQWAAWSRSEIMP